MGPLGRLPAPASHLGELGAAPSLGRAGLAPDRGRRDPGREAEGRGPLFAPPGFSQLVF